MFINASELDKAVKQVSAIANLDKNKPGVLFDILDNYVKVYYSTRQSAIEVTIDAVVDESDYKGKAIFDFNQLIKTLESCRSSGNIVVDNIEIKLVLNTPENGTATFTVNKYMKMANNPDGEMTLLSSNKYDAGWVPAEKAPLKSKVLAVKPCNDMYLEADAYSISVAELNGMIRRVTSGDARVIYMSNKFNGMFAPNTNNLIYAMCNETLGSTAQLSTASLKAISTALGYVDNSYRAIEVAQDIKSKIESITDKNADIDSIANDIADSMSNTELNLNVFGELEEAESAEESKPKAVSTNSTEIDTEVTVLFNTLLSDSGKQFAYLIFTPDHRCGIFMAAADKVNTHMTEISRYLGIKYNTFNFTIVTEILNDTLKSVNNLNASNDISISFMKKESGEIVAEIKAEDSGASVKNKYSLVCTSFNSLQQVEPGQVIMTIHPDKKALLNITKNNKNSYTALDAFISDNGNITIRIGFVSDEKAVEATQSYMQEHSIEGRKLTVEEKLEIRDKYLETCYYMATK